MAQNTNAQTAGWKEKGKTYLKYGLVIALIIWFVSTAFGAQGTANRNQKLIMRPQYKTFHIAGGPERFKSKFSEVENVEVKNVKNDSYLWSTLVYKNIGVAEGKDIEIKIHSVVPMERVLVTPPGWGSNVKVNMKNDGKQAVITMDDFSEEENAYIFLGMNPPGLSLNQEQLWLQEFDSYLEKSVIESNTADSVFYGEGYAGYFE